MHARLTIGTWHEAERTIHHCPSYYAADHETLRSRPGDYPAEVEFLTGYKVPMPYWLLVTLDTERISGALYSGAGGVNYAKTDLPPGEPVHHTLQLHAYQLRNLVDAGRVTLAPGFAWLLEDEPWTAEAAPKRWAEVSALREVQLMTRRPTALENRLDRRAVHVDFAYPTSPRADAFGCKEGCYVVIEDATGQLVIGPFGTVEEAEKAAADAGHSFSWLHVQAVRRGTR